MNKSNNKGFTLVELLATIAIIGILGTVAVTAVVRYLNSSRDKSYVMMSQALYEAGQNCVIQNKCKKDETIDNIKLKSRGFIDDLKNPISGNKDCTGSVDIPSDPIAGQYIVNLTCEGRKQLLRISWPNKDVYNIDQSESTDSENNIYIVNAYEYNKDNCSTGDESSCQETSCYKNSNANSCSTGTIIKYKVNDSETKTFYVIKDEGATLTMISKDKSSSKYNDDTYLDSSSGPILAEQAVNNMANNWANVKEHSYQTSNIGYTFTNGSPAIIDIWDGQTKSAHARLLTGNEAEDLGCFSSGCPKYISTWLSDFTYESKDVCYMSDSYGRCLSRKQIYEQAGYPIAVSSSFGFDYLDSNNEKDVQAVIKISKNNE